MARKHIRLGVEKLLEDQGHRIQGARLGLVCNQASVNHQLHHVADLLKEHQSADLRALFGPQHGIRGDVQDNMIETGHATDRETGLPIYSLYSAGKRTRVVCRPVLNSHPSRHDAGGVSEHVQRPLQDQLRA